MNQLLFWILFNLFVLGMLALDLGFLQRPGHTVKFREALTWSLLWIASGRRIRSVGLFSLWARDHRGVRHRLRD